MNNVASRVESSVPVKWNCPCTMSHESMSFRSVPSYAFRYSILPSSVGTFDEPSMLYVLAHDAKAMTDSSA